MQIFSMSTQDKLTKSSLTSFPTIHIHIMLTLTMAAIIVCWFISKSLHFKSKSISCSLILTKSTGITFKILSGGISPSTSSRQKISGKGSMAACVQLSTKLLSLFKECPLGHAK